MLQFILARDWESMNKMLHSLSNMEFKRMQSVMRTELLPRLDNALFWETLLHIIIFKKAAFISGALSASRLAKSGELNFECDEARALLNYLRTHSPESVVKIANMMITFLNSEEQINSMFKTFCINDEKERIAILIKETSPLAYYMLFKNLCQLQDDTATARKCCIFYMQKKDDRSYNMACILRSYFDIPNINTKFSLTIEPYELSYIERSYDTFLRILNGKRPSIF